MPPDLLREFMEEEARKGQANNNQQQTGQKMRRGGLAALHFAVRENDPASVKALVDAGADVNEVSEFG